MASETIGFDSTIPIDQEAEIQGATPWLLAFRDEIGKLGAPLAEGKSGEMQFELMKGEQALWIIATSRSGGRMAFCAAYTPYGTFEIESFTEDRGKVECRITTTLGCYRLLIELPHGSRKHLHWTTWLSPAEDLVLPFWPRDIYPLDASGNPLNTRGIIHACQRGPKAGLLYASFTRPEAGTILYMQNFTALNEYFEATHASPVEKVGGTWPELGFSLPPSRDGKLKKGKEIIISDPFILFSPELPASEGEIARLFLDLYAAMFLILPKPDPIHRHWPRRVADTIRDLTHSPECTVHIDGCRYLRAYVGSDDRPPESMVQLAVLVPLMEYAHWNEAPVPLIDELRESLPSFYNKELGTVVRWLPSLPYKKHEEVDSWYLYHTYLNLSRLALDGDETCRRLFLDSVDYGIRAAQHFEYRWPIFYHPSTFEVIKGEARPGLWGEHDVGGLYALVMLHALELTGEERFLQEAINAAQRLQGLGFSLGYQFNNTAFGAGALLRLWRMTGDDLYRDLSYVALANIFHNIWLWECDYGNARHYHTFMGLPPLHDGCYLAMYEELEVLAAFHEYLRIGGDDTPDPVRVLLAEYCKYLLDRAWFHYPNVLPADLLADESESGHLNRSISIPLEDLYDGWQKAGQVGQEIYGAAAPFVFSTRHCHRIPGTEFLLHCNYPTTDFRIETAKLAGAKSKGAASKGSASKGSAAKDSAKGSASKGSRSGRLRIVTFRIVGAPHCHCHVRVVSELQEPLPEVKVEVETGEATESIEGVMTEEGYLEYLVPGACTVTVTWEEVRTGNGYAPARPVMMDGRFRKKPETGNGHAPHEQTERERRDSGS